MLPLFTISFGSDDVSQCSKTMAMSVRTSLQPAILPRHELHREDGRRVLIYGELRGGYAEGAPKAGPGTSGIHQRLDVFTGAWIAVSPARNQRPLEDAAEGGSDQCPFCPGGFEIPFSYEAAVFDNRFPPFRPAPPPAPDLDGPTASALGRAEIVLYTSRHEASFGELSPSELGRVLAVWTDRSRELWADPSHRYVAVFENRGGTAGATIAHPHGQIYAVDRLPPVVAAKDAAHTRHRQAEGSCLSCDAIAVDAVSSRVVSANGSFAVAVPFAARWPYEVSVRARRHGARRLTDLDAAEQADLIGALAGVARRYDALFGFPLPYMMVAQEAPNDQPDWHLAFEFFPLNRAAEKVKIRASSETGLGLFLNDVAPEDAALRLAGLEVEGHSVEAGDLQVVVPAAAAD
jgi:UDPglucose--hexose-1-phosphate uridylyltransferase